MATFVKLTDVNTDKEIRINPATVSFVRASPQGTWLHLISGAGSNEGVIVSEPIGQVIAALAG